MSKTSVHAALTLVLLITVIVGCGGGGDRSGNVTATNTTSVPSTGTATGTGADLTPYMPTGPYSTDALVGTWTGTYAQTGTQTHHGTITVTIARTNASDDHVTVTGTGTDAELGGTTISGAFYDYGVDKKSGIDLSVGLLFDGVPRIDTNGHLVGPLGQYAGDGYYPTTFDLAPVP